MHPIKLIVTDSLTEGTNLSGLVGTPNEIIATNISTANVLLQARGKTDGFSPFHSLLAVADTPSREGVALLLTHPIETCRCSVTISSTCAAGDEHCFATPAAAVATFHPWTYYIEMELLEDAAELDTIGLATVSQIHILSAGVAVGLTGGTDRLMEVHVRGGELSLATPVDSLYLERGCRCVRGIGLAERVVLDTASLATNRNCQRPVEVAIASYYRITWTDSGWNVSGTLLPREARLQSVQQSILVESTAAESAPLYLTSAGGEPLEHLQVRTAGAGIHVVLAAKVAETVILSGNASLSVLHPQPFAFQPGRLGLHIPDTMEVGSAGLAFERLNSPGDPDTSLFIDELLLTPTAPAEIAAEVPITIARLTARARHTVWISNVTIAGDIDIAASVVFSNAIVTKSATISMPLTARVTVMPSANVSFARATVTGTRAGTYRVLEGVDCRALPTIDLERGEFSCSDGAVEVRVKSAAVNPLVITACVGAFVIVVAIAVAIAVAVGIVRRPLPKEETPTDALVKPLLL